MEFYQLEYFEAVARHENVSKAAEELHISQPALSKAISKLESELGVDLFDRVGKRLSLNEQGTFFRDSAARLLMHARESARELREFDGARSGTVRVVVRGPQKEALECTLAFMKENPRIYVMFDVQHSHDKSSSVWDADVVFAPVGMPFKASVGIPYSERDLELVIPQDHPYPGDGPVDLADFKDEPFAFLTRPYEYYELSYRLCIDSGFTPDVRLVTGSKPALLDFVRNGLGVGIVDGFKDRWGGLTALAPCPSSANRSSGRCASRAARWTRCRRPLVPTSISCSITSAFRKTGCRWRSSAADRAMRREMRQGDAKRRLRSAADVVPCISGPLFMSARHFTRPRLPANLKLG